jgi:hypothetical protein
VGGMSDGMHGGGCVETNLHNHSLHFNAGSAIPF